MGQIGKGLEYMKSIPCILKIIEIVVLLIAFSLAGHFVNDLPNKFFDYFEKKGNIDFFLFATIVGWLIAIAFAIIFMVGIHEKVSAVPWTLVVAIVSAIWTILLLVSSALLAAAVKHYDDNEPNPLWKGITACKILDPKYNSSDSRCGHLVGATILGFIATLLFAVDTAIHVRMVLTQGSATTAAPA